MPETPATKLVTEIRELPFGNDSLAATQTGCSLHLAQFMHALNLTNATPVTLHAVTLMTGQSHHVKLMLNYCNEKVN